MRIVTYEVWHSNFSNFYELYFSWAFSELYNKQFKLHNFTKIRTFLPWPCVTILPNFVISQLSSFFLRNSTNKQTQWKPNELLCSWVTFGGKNPQVSMLHLNEAPLFWVEKVKYLGTYIQCNTGITDLSCNIRKFYSQFNNVLSVLGSMPMRCQQSTLHLVKAYCLPALLYGVETWSLNNTICF